MNYDTNSIFDRTYDEKGQAEWQTFRKVTNDKVSAFEVVSPRSSYEPRYTNIVHINRYRTV
jgi:hypothetical protein